MRYFLLDASALAKRYTLEAGSDPVDALFARAAFHQLLCLMVSAAEVVSVLVRKRNRGEISPASFSQGLSNLQAKVLDEAGFTTLALENQDIARSLRLIDRHALNATDAAILQIALDLAEELRSGGDGLVLVASDQRLLRAATAEGLVTFDPETGAETDLDALIGA